MGGVGPVHIPFHICLLGFGRDETATGDGAEGMAG